MKILGVIPARGRSKGIHKKNIRVLGNKPLIAYTIESALNSRLDNVIVSTNSEEIANISTSYGAEIIIRPDTLANDFTPTLPVLQDVYKNLNVSYDALMTLQPTSPFRTDHHINESIKIFNKEKNIDCLVSVVEIPHNMSNQKTMSLKNGLLIGEFQAQRRQEVKKTYARNGAIYITKCNKLNNYIFGGRILPYFMDKISSIDIDDIQDWELSEIILRGIKNG